MKLILISNEERHAKRILESNYFLSFCTALLLKDSVTLVLLDTLRVFSQQLLYEHFGSNRLCVLLIVAVVKAVENLLRYISATAHLDLFLNEFQLLY